MKKNSAFSLIELSIVILIIGIIIAGVTQASRLVKQMRLSSAKTLTQSSAINSIKGLALWLEPTMDNSFTSATNGNSPDDNDKISAWNDINPQSSSKVNPLQATDGSRPTYLSGSSETINGLPALKFDGSSSYLASIAGSGGNVPLLAGDDSYTFIAVWKTLDAANGGNAQVIFEQNQDTAVSGKRASFIVLPGSYGFSGEGNDYSDTCSYAEKSPYASLMNVDDSGNVTIHTNSVNASCTGSVGPATADVSGNGFYVGVKGDGTEFFNGIISEIIVFDRPLKKAEIADVMNYLSKKYGIKLN